MNWSLPAPAVEITVGQDAPLSLKDAHYYMFNDVMGHL